MEKNRIELLNLLKEIERLNDEILFRKKNDSILDYKHLSFRDLKKNKKKYLKIVRKKNKEIDKLGIKRYAAVDEKNK